MINLDWRKSVEIIGVLALVISLLFVGLQMKQTNEVAFLELDTAMVGTAVDIAELISSNPDVWVKGNAGEELTASEQAVYIELLSAMNTRLVVMESHAYQLGRDEISHLIRRDWAAFLHQNPGARRAWLSREDKLIQYRRLAAPDAEDFSGWRDSVLSELEALDSAVE
ncbi:MAG: hypothetical protein QNJ40_16630 [Xanthomonadales bacterium]|nr:hypothetical protein [Xanthomonadales bacterium]